MISVSTFPNVKIHHIRKMDLSRDLVGVADLIETCFPIHLDPDGQDYIREMRRAARDLRLLGWLSPLSELGNVKASGFVWEEDGQIVGNLSLIPFKMNGVGFHLIANVAVHPEFRRRGIARSLTEWTLNNLRRHKEPYVWLQVRDNNKIAQRLYRSVGFVDKLKRTTWRIQPFNCKSSALITEPQVRLRRQVNGDWGDHEKWLRSSYPELMRWNLPVNFRRFEPGLFHRLVNIIDGTVYRHWAIETRRELQGVVSWQKTDHYANNLWLAFPTEVEGEILTQALILVLKRLSRKHPLAVDYPKGRCSEVFKALGFDRFRTLIWMRSDL